jgi:hypothetical protein
MELPFGLFALFEGGLTIIASFERIGEKEVWTLCSNVSLVEPHVCSYWRGGVSEAHLGCK